MINLDAPALLDAVSKISATANSVKSGSLIQYTGSTRITPFTLVDRTLLAVPELQDVLQILASLYSGYYLMGVQLTVNSIDGISVVRQLDKLNPNRRSTSMGEKLAGATRLGNDAKGIYDTASNLGRENYQFRLPRDKPLKQLVYQDTLATEARNDNLTPEERRENEARRIKERAEDSADARFGKVTKETNVGKSLETITQDSNLAVGKLLEVNVTINNQKMSIPVNVRLNTFNVSPNEMESIVANIDPHKSAKEIKALYQAGIIDLWDALTGKSAANEWRKAALEDKTGTILRESNRRSGNKLTGLFSGEQSFGDISGIYVMSANTARQVEGIIGGKLSNFKVREKMLAKTGVMLLAVVDSDWKRVTIYHHSIDGESAYSFADLKRGGKSNNQDIGVVLEAFRQGQAPGKFF